MKVTKKRDSWGSRIGIIMAVAGSALGLGNFLRFPVQAAKNGGGAFLIPYFIALVFLGIPLMWVEWSLGRYGGLFGHGTGPGVFHSLRRQNRFIKYFGIIGIFGPLVIFIYYLYIESWILAYSFFSITGHYSTCTDQSSLQSFLSAYQGLVKNQYFSGILVAYLFFIVTFVINMGVIYRGLSKGIEKLCKYAMPVLFFFAIVITIRVFTLGGAHTGHAERTVSQGLGFLWNPDFSALKNPDVWLAAAGQVFFTLSVGIGVIITYASYLKRGDDVVLSGLTAVSVNEFAEVILGGSIIIPAAFMFFGSAGVQQVAEGGAFNMSFVTMPLIFGKIPLGLLFGGLWFALLFLAGLTSSVSLAQPAISFMEDEFGLSRKKSVMILSLIAFICCQPAIFLLGNGVVDELDFWGGTFSLVLFATIEIILFAWVFGINNAWEEMHHGSEIKIPKIYKFIIKYITPLFLLTILISWFVKKGIPFILMKGVPEKNLPYILGTRVFLLGLVVLLAVLVKIAWKKRKLSDPIIHKD